MIQTLRKSNVLSFNVLSFGIKKNSTVSSIVDRVKYEMSRDKGVRLRFERLIKTFSNSQT